MNLTKLFEIQKQLDERIVMEHNLQGQDLLPKKILALQVELGELANEWRGFKFWSNNQKPRVSQEIECPDCNEYDTHMCCTCQGLGSIELGHENPLLEEYVDCLHFILSVGLELKITDIEGLEPFKARSGLIQQFNVMFKHISGLTMQLEAYNQKGYEKYYHIFNLFIGLGEMLGFTWEQTEQAYLEKNKINHQRQESGY